MLVWIKANMGVANINVDWVETDIHRVVRGVVAATSARVFVGLPACRNPDWLSTSVGYAEDLNYTSIITRFFPEWIHPVAVWCNPFRWRLAHHYKVAGRITAELLQARKTAIDEGREPEDTLLNWMMDKGSEQETELDEMAARLCVLNTLSIHTTLSVLAALFSDFAATQNGFRHSEKRLRMSFRSMAG